MLGNSVLAKYVASLNRIWALLTKQRIEMASHSISYSPPIYLPIIHIHFSFLIHPSLKGDKSSFHSLLYPVPHPEYLLHSSSLPDKAPSVSTKRYTINKKIIYLPPTSQLNYFCLEKDKHTYKQSFIHNYDALVHQLFVE